MQDSQEILQDVLAQDWAHCGNQQQLAIQALQHLRIARQRLLLSNWMQGQEQYAPAFHLVEEVRQVLLNARQDASPKVVWQGWQFRRYQNQLYRLPAHLPKARDMQIQWLPDQQLELPSGCWQWQQQAFGFPVEMIQQATWQLQARRGGESLHLRGQVGHRSLKKNLQDAGLTPWQREQVHMLIQDSQVYGILTAQGFWPVMQPAWIAQGWLPVLCKEEKDVKGCHANESGFNLID